MNWLNKIFSKSSAKPKHNFRILFATDLHGSNTCFKILVNTLVNKYSPDVLIIGGDITGKDLVYIFNKPNGDVYSSERGSSIQLKTEEEIQFHIKKLGDSGTYTYRCSEEEYESLIVDKNKQESILKELIEKRIEEWVEFADVKLADKNLQFVINTGNDDFFSIDEKLKKSKTMIFGEGSIIPLKNGYVLISCGYANKTPFNCPRDIDEGELYTLVKSYIEDFKKSGGDNSKLILNLHCPPLNTKLDIAQKLKEGNKPVMSPFGKENDTVGSSAIRKIIEEYKPKLGLHGHIHEAPAVDAIGDTIIVNPGSEYQSGILKHALIDFFDDNQLKCSIKS